MPLPSLRGGGALERVGGPKHQDFRSLPNFHRSPLAMKKFPTGSLSVRLRSIEYMAVWFTLFLHERIELVLPLLLIVTIVT